jgi:MerR family mercuric resistance operon transcriptional regulator
MRTETVTISQLAAAAEVNVETVRYYQRRGLLPEPPRPAGGIRRYGGGVISRLQFIRRAQSMGFSLDEIAGLLEVRGRQACEQTRQMTELKLIDVRRRLDALRQLESDLEALVEDCAKVRLGDCCPTLDLLEQAGSPLATPQSLARRQKPSQRHKAVFPTVDVKQRTPSRKTTRG